MPDPFIEFGNLVPDVVSSYGTTADQRVRETRAKLYREMPNDAMEESPLTKIVMSNIGASKQAPEFEWGMIAHDDRYIKATGAYDSSALNSAISATAQTAAGVTVYIKMAAADARRFVVYEEVEMRFHASTGETHADHDATVHGMVMSRAINGVSSYISVKLYEQDLGNGGVNGNVLGRFAADYSGGGILYVTPISVAMPEGSGLPWHRYREPTEKKNYIQTIMAGLALTGEELTNAQRFDSNTYERYWKQVFDYFNYSIESAILFGSRRNDTVDVDLGNESQTLSQYRTGGLRWMFKHTDFGDNKNIFDIRRTTTFEDYDFTGKTWEEGGYDYFKLLLLYLSKKSGKRKKLYCSGNAKLAILNLFESMTQVQISPHFKDKWGFEVTRIDGLNCSLEISQHALLSLNPGLQSTGFIIEPELLWGVEKKGRGMTVIRSVKDLKDKAKVQDGFGWRDMTKEGIFTTFGFGADNLDAMCMLKGIGSDFASS